MWRERLSGGRTWSKTLAIVSHCHVPPSRHSPSPSSNSHHVDDWCRLGQWAKLPMTLESHIYWDLICSSRHVKLNFFPITFLWCPLYVFLGHFPLWCGLPQREIRGSLDDLTRALICQTLLSVLSGEAKFLPFLRHPLLSTPPKEEYKRMLFLMVVLKFLKS